MFQKLGDALRRFMYGRYGADSLNKWLLIFSVVLMLVGGLGSRYLAPWMAAFGTLAYVPLIWSMFRIYSRNIEARRRENAAFQRFFTRLRDRQNRYFTCPRCRQVVRVPRGKGASISAAPNAASSSSKKPEKSRGD